MNVGAMLAGASGFIAAWCLLCEPKERIAGWLNLILMFVYMLIPVGT